MIAPVLTAPTYRRLNCQNLNEVSAVVDLLNRTSDCQSTFAELVEYTTRHYWLGFVAVGDRTNEVIGVLFYSAYPHGRKVEIVAVDRDHRRQGVGAGLLKSLVDVVAAHDWIREITSLVPERNVPMQMLLKAAKFQYVETFDPVGKDDEDDQYLFVLKKQDSECCEVGAERELVGVV